MWLWYWRNDVSSPLMRWLLPCVFALASCGGASPSAPAVVPTVTAEATVAPALPVGVDPEYARALGSRRWVGGPFHHCFSPEVDRATVDAIIVEMSALTGISQTTAGTCTVQWIADYGRRDHSYTEILGTETTIISARVFLYHAGAMTARHEAGHVIGLSPDHSPRPEDLMYASPRAENFSHDELAVLAWMYGR